MSVLVLSALALSACRSSAADCRPEDGWKRGERGEAAIPGCVAPRYREAHELGRSLHELLAERKALDARIAADPAAEGVLRRRQRQIDIDIEAIRGVVVVERWQVDGR
ncbi:MAG: hypothetical protein WCZ65_03960 [Lysobacteraceae bacterium]